MRLPYKTHIRHFKVYITWKGEFINCKLIKHFLITSSIDCGMSYRYSCR